MAGTFDVNVDARKLDVGKNATMSRQDAIDAVKEGLLAITISYPAVSASSAEAVLLTEGAQRDPVQKVRLKLKVDRHTLVASAHSRSIKRALERALDDLERQARRLKEKKSGQRRRVRRAWKRSEQKNSSVPLEYYDEEE